MSAYAELERRFKRPDDLAGAQAQLQWDGAVMMPPGGAAARADQLATLAGLSHQLLVMPEIGDLLEQSEAEALDPWQTANREEMHRLRRHARALPADLVEALSQATSVSEMAWREARHDDDFARLQPDLEGVVDLTRQAAAAKASALDCQPYDALLDAYDPGTKWAQIEPIFNELESFLPEFLAATAQHQAAQPVIPFDVEIPADAQRALAPRLLAALGFDFAHGRLDESHHPFSGGTPDDVRLTTRYGPDFSHALMAVLHEGGHGLYERGLPAAWRGQPVGQARGMTLHESQSLIIEMQACRSPQFLAWLAPELCRAFQVSGPAWQAENLIRHSHRVAPGLIRVDADEVSYPLHIILRTRLERALLTGDLQVAELPGAWRDGMQALLGITPADDRDGCLQDIHWPEGAFGYFPTYTLGALAAAQFFAAARSADSGIPEALGRGDFGPLLAWLRPNVHEIGSSLSTAEIVTRATGAPLGTAPFRSHLEARYGA